MSAVGAVLAWWLLSLLVGLAVFPATGRLLGSLPDRGYPVARAAGLLGLAYATWLAATLGLLANRPGSRLLVLLVAVSLSAWGWRHSPELWGWIRQQRRLLLASEGVFLVALALWAVVRAFDPAIQGTEKPMELAFLNASLASPRYPPQDPWLAGYAISYYYLGYVLVAWLGALSGVTAGVAFNLGVALLFALTVSLSWSLVANLTALLRQEPLRRAWPWGGAGALAVAGLGNLEGLLELLHGKGIGSPAFYQWLDIRDLAAAPRFQGWAPEQFWWWWRASRVVRDRLFGADQMVIDEFPFFSFLLADLHPHLLALPFTLMALSLVLAALLEGRRWSLPGWRPLAVAALLAGLVFLNAWDYPTYAGLAVAALALGAAEGRRRPALAFGLLLVAVAVALNLPQLVSFRSQTRGLGLVLLAKTRWPQFLVMFGILLYPVVGHLLGEALRRDRRPGPRGLGAAALWLLPAALMALLGWTVALLLWLGLGLALALLGGRPATPAEAARSYLLLLIAAGFMLTLAVEFVLVRDVFGTRMNTVFKLYYQAWVLWAAAGAAGAALWWRRLTGLGRLAPALPLAALVLSGLYYPLAATHSKTAGLAGPATLDGTAYLAQAHRQDYRAIRWLQERAPRGAVLLEAAGWEQYGRLGRMATFSGRPAVLGWGGHEVQWGRSGELVGQRVEEVRRIYETPDASVARAGLDELGVSLVVVGDLERQRYRVEEEKFGRFLEAVYRDEGLVIYGRPGLIPRP